MRVCIDSRLFGSRCFAWNGWQQESGIPAKTKNKKNVINSNELEIHTQRYGLAILVRQHHALHLSFAVVLECIPRSFKDSEAFWCSFFFVPYIFHHIPATLRATIPLQLGAVPWRNTPGGPMTKRQLLGMQKVDQLRGLRIAGFSWDESYGLMISSRKDNPNWEHNSTATVDHKERFSKVSFF